MRPTKNVGTFRFASIPPLFLPPSMMNRTASFCAGTVRTAFAFFLIPLLSIGVEPPQLTRLEPNCAVVDQTTQFRAVGQFKSWPVQVWSSSQNVIWSCQSEPGVFQVSVTGPIDRKEFWVRFFNPAGTTIPHRVFVTAQPALLEKEPNDQPRNANAIEPDQIVCGVLEKNVDVDCFQIHLTEGEPLSAIVDSHRYGTPVDANLQVLDSRGFVIAESIDHFGLDPAISYTAKYTGIHYVKVFAFPAEPDSTISFRGGPDWWYRLRCLKAILPYELPSARESLLSGCTMLETAAGQSIESAVSLKLQEKTFQTIRPADEKAASRVSPNHYYKLPQTPGVPIRIEVTAQSMGSGLDPTLTIIDESGKQQAFHDDSGNDRDASILWTIPDEKNYYAVVGDFHRRGGVDKVYWISLTRVQPRVQMSAALDSYLTKVNQEIEIKLNIEKPSDWSGEVLLLSANPNLNIVLEPSSAKIEKETKEIIAKLRVTGIYSGVLPIELKLKESDAVLLLVGPHAATVPSWLTVSE